ncbi:MAG: YncE family protein, partial [Terriglobia bacterium]
MKRQFCLLVVIILTSAFPARPQSGRPLTFIQTIIMPGVPVGPYTDHLSVDLKGRRLFATPQAKKAVQVFDLASGKLLHEIGGLGNPHSIVYRSDLNRIYVVDGEPGLVRVYDGHDYRALQTIKLLRNADSAAYDPRTKLMYVTNGGEEAHLDHSFISVIDTTAGRHVADINIPSPGLEAMALESKGPDLYVDIIDGNKIGVVDRLKRKLVATWPVTKGRRNIAIALDEDHHRLFVGCRNTDMNGVIVIMDTQTGKELGTALPIGGWVDYLAFDAASGRLYA